MDLTLAGRTVVVTGGASNIGRAIALGFATEAAAVYLADIDEPQAMSVIAEAPDGLVVFHRTDVTKPDDAKSVIDRAIRDRGRIDVLVNNAGWAVDRLFME